MSSLLNRLASASRTLAGSVRAAHNFPTYPVPPRMPMVDGFLRDNRPGERKFVENYVSKVDGRILRIELADAKDIDLFGQHVTEIFITDCAMFANTGISYEEMAPMWFNMVADMLPKNVSFLVFDEDKVVAHLLDNLHDPEEFREMYVGDLHSERPQFVIKPDYSSDIKNGPFPSLKANRIWTILDECYTQTGKFLPKTIKKLAVGEAMGIHKNYKNSKLGNRLMEIGRDYCKAAGADYMTSYCVAHGSKAIMSNVGLTPMYELPYKQFTENGEPVFQDLFDGCEELVSLGGKI